MIYRLTAVFLFISAFLSGCSLYNNYPFEYYENTVPDNQLVFNMEDSTECPVDASKIAMVKNSPDYYTIYFKNGESLSLRKDQIASVKMLDKRQVQALQIIFGITIGTLAVAGMVLVVIAIANAL